LKAASAPEPSGNGKKLIYPKCLWLLTVFVKKRCMSSWVFTAMQSVRIQMNSSLSPPLKKILDPPMKPKPKTLTRNLNPKPNPKT